jgi:hypothetical protein
MPMNLCDINIESGLFRQRIHNILINREYRINLFFPLKKIDLVVMAIAGGHSIVPALKFAGWFTFTKEFAHAVYI